MTKQEWFQNFIAISLWNLNLFSFMLGMIYTLLNVTLRNQRFLWFQVVLYVSIIALYFYLKSEIH